MATARANLDHQIALKVEAIDECQRLTGLVNRRNEQLTARDNIIHDLRERVAELECQLGRANM